MAFVKLLERIPMATGGAFSQLARRPALWAGSFSYLFLIIIVRHLTCATFTGPDGVDGICGDIFGFQKSFGLCVRGCLWSVSLPIYLYILRDGAPISTIERFRNEGGGYCLKEQDLG